MTSDCNKHAPTQTGSSALSKAGKMNPLLFGDFKNDPYGQRLWEAISHVEIIVLDDNFGWTRRLNQIAAAVPKVNEVNAPVEHVPDWKASAEAARSF